MPRHHHSFPRFVFQGLLYVTIALLGFSLGYLARSGGWPDSRAGESSAKHWSLIESYQSHLREQANWSIDHNTGLRVIINPPDPLPSLAALVAAGELSHADVVLPLVPANPETNVAWMRYVADHPEIVHAFGDQTYAGLTPQGDRPVHLNLWYKPTATHVVQGLIDELERLGTE